MSAPGHALDLEHRGPEHRHRWVAACRCGKWAAIPLRLKRSAIAAHRGHVRAVTPRTNARRRPTAQPVPITPEHRLPPALRSRGAG